MNKEKRQYTKYQCKSKKKTELQIIIISNIKEALVTELLKLEQKKKKIVETDEHLFGIEKIISRMCEINFELKEYSIISNELEEKIKKLV